MQADIEKLRFPIGRYKRPLKIEEADLLLAIAQIAKLPSELVQILENMSEEELDTPYRPDGWTARQVVHHLADSHLNSYTRFKLALTEAMPTIKPYNEVKWAALPDYQMPVEVSLSLLQGLHHRWVYLMKHLGKRQWNEYFFHPDMERDFRLDEVALMYAWHGKHHLGHINLVVQNK